MSPPESIQGRAGKSTGNGNGNSNGGENRSNATATKITVNFLNRLTKRLDACVAEAARNKNGADVPVISMHSLPPITKMVPYTSFENGVQVIKNPWILDKLTSKEQAENGHANGGAADEDATVTMVVPQDPGYRLHGMSLRTRRHPDPSVAVKEISKREQELYERLASKCGQKCDLSTLQCLVCKKVFKVCKTFPRLSGAEGRQRGVPELTRRLSFVVSRRLGIPLHLLPYRRNRRKRPVLLLMRRHLLRYPRPRQL